MKWQYLRRLSLKCPIRVCVCACFFFTSLCICGWLDRHLCACKRQIGLNLCVATVQSDFDEWATANWIEKIPFDRMKFFILTKYSWRFISKFNLFQKCRSFFFAEKHCWINGRNTQCYLCTAFVTDGKIFKGFKMIVHIQLNISIIYLEHFGWLLFC